MQIPLNEIKFDRLGYLSLDANERSGFSARELKSVYVDTAAGLLIGVSGLRHDWTEFCAVLSSYPPHTRCGPCSPSCPC